VNLSWRELPTKGWGESKSCPIFENYLSSWGFRGLDRWCLELDMIAEYLVLSLRVLKRISLPAILTLQVIILSIQLSSPFHANQNPPSHCHFCTESNTILPHLRRKDAEKRKDRARSHQLFQKQYNSTDPPPPQPQPIESPPTNLNIRSPVPPKNLCFHTPSLPSQSRGKKSNK